MAFLNKKSFPGVKLPACGADHLNQSSAEFKNG